MFYFLFKKLRAKYKESQREKNGEAKTYPQCSHRDEPSFAPCLQCKQQCSSAVKYRWKIILCLIFPYALQALDATIIASALPWIASDFNELSEQNWIVSAFNLSTAAFIPFWAQMADVFGRTIALSSSVAIMLIGSALCTSAPTNAFPVLLLGRGFQGLSAAGISVVVRVILADKVSLKENARNWAIFSLVGGVSYALGPVIGGYLTSTDWRWCFAINLPVAVVALLIIIFILRKDLLGPQPIPELDQSTTSDSRGKLIARLKTIDIGGQILFLFGFGLIILALTWGGVDYSWDSAAVLAPLIVGVLLVVAFATYERSMKPGGFMARKLSSQKPMITWELISNRDMGILFFAEAVNGMGMYAVLYFCNIYFIAVKGYDSDEAGTQLLYFTPGIAGGVLICLFITQVYPRTTWSAIFLGTLVESLALSLLAWAMYTEDSSTIYGFMAMVGAGVGIRVQASPLHGIGLFRHHRPGVIALLAVALTFGGAFGLTIMTTVFNNTSGIGADGGSLQSRAESSETYDAKMGVVWAFVAIAPFSILAWVGSLFLGSVTLGDGEGPDEDGLQNVVIKEPYLWYLLRGGYANDRKMIRDSMETELHPVSKRPTADDAAV